MITPIDWITKVHAAAAAATGECTGLEIVTVSDRYAENVAIRLAEASRGLPDPSRDHRFSEALRAAGLLRWCLAVQPYPLDASPEGVATALVHTLESLRQAQAVADAETASALAALATAAEEVRDWRSPAGQVALETIRETGSSNVCLVVARGRLAGPTRTWLAQEGVDAQCLTPGQLMSGNAFWEQAVLLGTPQMFSGAVFTAPRAIFSAFIHGGWLRDREFPRAPLDHLAEASYRPRSRTFAAPRQYVPSCASTDGAAVVPQPAWPEPDTQDPTVLADSELAVECRRLLLAGGHRLMLDTGGERIRGLDLTRQAGDRIVMIDTEAAVAGAVLVIRAEGSEATALRTLALAHLGAQCEEVQRSQDRWKAELQTRIDHDGIDGVRQALAARGVTAFRRAMAWIDPELIRPRTSSDFAALLSWLEVDTQSFIKHADLLYRAHRKVAADVGHRMERALSTADMRLLEERGHITVSLDLPGFGSMVAARVIARSPHLELVPARDVRVLLPDRSALWLE